MTISKEEFEQLKARTTVTEVALAYAINNLSAKFQDIKPSVISALNNDAETNEAHGKNNIADALHNLASLIERFNYTDEKQ